MKKEWQDICTGDVITVKRNNKHICVYVSDIFTRPLTKSDTIEVIDFYNNNITTFLIDHEDFCNIDSKFEEAIDYKFKKGALIDVKTSSGKLPGTIVSLHEPAYRPYPRDRRTKVHTFFVPQYSVMFTDGSIIVVEERKLRLISNP